MGKGVSGDEDWLKGLRCSVRVTSEAVRFCGWCCLYLLWWVLEGR